MPIAIGHCLWGTTWEDILADCRTFGKTSENNESPVPACQCPTMKSFVDECMTSLGAAMDQVVGATAVDLDSRFASIRTQDPLKDRAELTAIETASVQQPTRKQTLATLLWTSCGMPWRCRTDGMGCQTQSQFFSVHTYNISTAQGSGGSFQP